VAVKNYPLARFHGFTVGLTAKSAKFNNIVTNYGDPLNFQFPICCLPGMLSLALVVLKDKIQSLVLALAVKVSPWSWPWTSSPWQLVESFYHNRLVVQWYGPWFTSLGNTDYLQHINSPTCNQPESPLPLLCQKFASIQPFLATFCVRRLRLHLWNMCSLRVDCSCVQIKHACPTLCWKLWSSLNATVLFVC